MVTGCARAVQFICPGSNFFHLELDQEKFAHLLFAPENTIIKQINGERVRAHDLIEYMQSYVEIFNRNDLHTIYMDTTEVVDSILIKKCLKFYTVAMVRKSAAKNSYSAEAFVIMHEHFMHRATKMVNTKLGGGLRLAQLYDAMEKEFLYFFQENTEKLRMRSMKETVLVATVLGGIVNSLLSPLGTLAGSWLGSPLTFMAKK